MVGIAYWSARWMPCADTAAREYVASQKFSATYTSNKTHTSACELANCNHDDPIERTRAAVGTFVVQASARLNHVRAPYSNIQCRHLRFHVKWLVCGRAVVANASGMAAWLPLMPPRTSPAELVVPSRRTGATGTHPRSASWAN